MSSNLHNVIKQFVNEREVSSFVPFGGGHINETFAICDNKGEKRWILQKINHHVFTNVEVLQRNIKIVGDVLKTRLQKSNDPDWERKYLEFLPIKSEVDKNYYYDGSSYWRMCKFIPRSKTITTMNEDSARFSGKAFGQFEEMLSNIPEGVLEETIDNFHSMSWRLQQLDEVVAKDPVGRVSKSMKIIEEIEKRRSLMLIQDRLYELGKLPKRTIHCDTKVDNILFDEDDGSVLCVVDWDTVMPGYILSDVGDFIRTAVNTGAEDESDLSKISVNMQVYKSFIEGYLSTAGLFINETERLLIAYGGRLMTYMQTVRFLIDYIDGDNYFKVHHKEHNLQRAKAQLRFLECLEDKAQAMEAILY